MKCPECATDLKRKRLKQQQVEVDQCPGCRGTWFDAGELKEVLEDLASPRKTLPADARKSDHRNCPRCAMPLYEYLYPETEVSVDNCKSCGGTWLDHQELAAIREVRRASQSPAQTAGESGSGGLLSRLKFW